MDSFLHLDCYRRDNDGNKNSKFTEHTNDTTAAVINMANASSSIEDAQNMSVIEATSENIAVISGLKSHAHYSYFSYDLIASE